MMNVKATKDGLVVSEPDVVAYIDGKRVGAPKSLSEVSSRYGSMIDLDHLKTFGYQKNVLPNGVLEFKTV